MAKAPVPDHRTPQASPLTEVVDHLDDVATQETVRVSDILSDFGSASFAAVLLILSVILVSPLSGVPLLSTTVGLCIATVAAQGAVGRQKLWLPDRLLRSQFSTQKMSSGMGRLQQLAHWIDRRTARRLAPLVGGAGARILYGVSALFGLILPALELVPFSSSLIGAGIALVATGLLVKDGLIAMIGLLWLSFAALFPVFTIRAVLSA